jgi:DNA-binding NtrC family response regulator
MNDDQRPITAAAVLATLGLGVAASLRDARRAFERAYIQAVLLEHGGRVAEAARALGLQRPNLYRKARQLSIALRPPATDREP